MSAEIRVLVWTSESGLSTASRPIAYKEGIHKVIAGFLSEAGDIEPVAVSGDREALTASKLKGYDCLVLWAHGEPISEEVQKDIINAVESGSIGVVGLHSILVFRAYPRLVGKLFGYTTDNIWEDEITMKVSPSQTPHPILDGVEEFEVDDEAYFEPLSLAEDVRALLSMRVVGRDFCNPNVPDYETGVGKKVKIDVRELQTRVGWTREPGLGRTFYLQPGHEMNPTYLNRTVQRVIINAVRWVSRRT